MLSSDTGTVPHPNEGALNTLRSILARMRAGSDPEIQGITESKEQVLTRYQPIFSAEHLPHLTEEEFRSFLLFENNRHWTNLPRKGYGATEDMGALRQALLMLINESRPLEERLRALRPKSGPPMVKYLGRAVITPILMIHRPDEYGVLNTTAEGAMQALKLWPELERGVDFAQRYIAVNRVLREVAHHLGIDLWTLDALWWRVEKPAEPNEDPPTAVLPAIRPDKEASFGLERHLHDFLFDNWEQTEFGREWTLHEIDGEIVGREYDTRAVGRIDLLARHRTEPRWLVVELKRDQGIDATIGQVLRYCGWVEHHLVEVGEEVEGVIVCREEDPRLKYALKRVHGVRAYTYEVTFTLKPTGAL